MTERQTTLSCQQPINHTACSTNVKYNWTTSEYCIFYCCRKNHQRALDTIQISLEAEARGRLEALRQRKKLEQDVLELEAALEATVKARAEVEKNYKRFQQQIRDLELVLEEEQAATQVHRLLFDDL